MNSVNASCRESTLDSFFCVEISDLLASSVAGGAVVGVNANAYAFGNSSLALTNTKTTAKQFGNGGSISMGWGTAVAGGYNPSASVSVFGVGNTVLAYTSTTSSLAKKNSSQNNLVVSTGFVLAIDYH